MLAWILSTETALSIDDHVDHVDQPGFVDHQYCTHSFIIYSGLILTHIACPALGRMELSGPGCGD